LADLGVDRVVAVRCGGNLLIGESPESEDGVKLAVTTLEADAVLMAQGLT